MNIQLSLELNCVGLGLRTRGRTNETGSGRDKVVAVTMVGPGSVVIEYELNS